MPSLFRVADPYFRPQRFHLYPPLPPPAFAHGDRFPPGLGLQLSTRLHRRLQASPRLLSGWCLTRGRMQLSPPLNSGVFIAWKRGGKRARGLLAMPFCGRCHACRFLLYVDVVRKGSRFSSLVSLNNTILANTQYLAVGVTEAR